MKVRFVLPIIMFSICMSAQEQSPAPSTQGQPERVQRDRGARGGGFGFGGSTGTISEIKDGVLTVKTSEGKILTVKTSGDTRLMGKDRSPIAMKDLKVGDYVAAAGQTSAEGTIEARLVALLDEESVKRMKEAQANLGKTNIAGEVKEINETKLTVLRIDGQTQVIEVDENTSLKKQGESITLADIKPGDRLSGPGELKNGVFFAKELRVGMPGGQRRSQDRMVRPETSKPEKQ